MTDSKQPDSALNREAAGTTIEDVAAFAGVSTMTVSRVLRNKGNVSQKTQNRVMQAIEQLGYVPNLIASSLAAAKPTQIAVLVPTLESTVFTELLAGITTALDATPYHAIIGTTHYRPDKQLSLIRSMLGWRPAGFIVVGHHHLPGTKQLLKASGVPVVEVLELTRNPIDMCVGVNQHAAGAAMAGHLLEKGYRRFSYIGSDHKIDRPAHKRFKGFNSTLSKSGISIEASYTAPKVSGITMGKALMQELLSNKQHAEVVYCSNDSVAVGCTLQCLESNIKIPDDIAIASFSGLDIAAAMPVPITTVHSPRRTMGQTSASMILQRLAGKKTTRIVDSGFTLIEGKSS